MNKDPFDIFPEMMRNHIDDLYNGKMKKGIFIGMYMEKIKNFDNLPEHSSKFKYPQFVSMNSKDRSDNWLDFILSLPKDQFEEFKRGLSFNK